MKAFINICVLFQYKDHLFRVYGYCYVRSSYLYNGNFYTGKTALLYWNSPWVQCDFHVRRTRENTVVVVVILFPKEYNMMHSIRTTFQQFHKCIPLAVAREAQWLIELTTAILTMIQLSSFPNVKKNIPLTYTVFAMMLWHIRILRIKYR